MTARPAPARPAWSVADRRSPSEAGARFPFAGTAQVVRFNWPKYVASVVLAVAAGAVAAGTVPGLPAAVAVPLVSAAALGVFWTVTSLVATWWVYDHRRVYDRLAARLSPVGRWASVHAGFDDATPRLARAVGFAPTAVVELALHQRARASLRRARQAPGPTASTGALPCPIEPPAGSGVTGLRSRRRDGGDGYLALPDGQLDTVFVTFAAHEVRDPAAQRAVFAGLRRGLRPGGRLVVTEHLRDLANLAVYGPGAFHFQPARTWHQRAAEAGFVLVDDLAVTPFVHRFTWRR